MRLLTSLQSAVGLVFLIITDECFSFVTKGAFLVQKASRHRRVERLEALNDEAPRDKPNDTKKVVVVGGGWAGFSAADAISSDPSTHVTLLDASPRGQGGLAGGWRTRLGRSVEAGLHGFWREYKNTFATMERIGIDLDEALTPFTPSILVSKTGRVALAPVLGEEEEKTHTDIDMNAALMDPKSLVESVAVYLPPPLDVALLSNFSNDSQLSLMDRASGIGLLGAWADFGQEDEASWKRYDTISAENLFCVAAGVSPVLYRELVSPLLHVLPMTPGYDCSAAAALSCFHVFALQSRGAFDVRWCRGTIAETIFNPWTIQLQSRGNVEIIGSSRVSSIEKNSSTMKNQFEVTVNDQKVLDCDAVVMAVGATSMKKIAPYCPPLREVAEKKRFNKLRGVTCVAVRLFLQPAETTTFGMSGGMYNSTQLPLPVAQAMKDSPVVVCGPGIGHIPQLAETGFCIYDLQRLHNEFAVENQGASDKETCAALEVDFFRADTIADEEDDNKVAKLALRAVASALNVPPLDPSLILDVSVVRARDAVSHFCVNSASSSPDVKIGKGIYMCGDWIDRTGHASWSTEKAVVTGRQAAASLADDFGLACSTGIVPAAADTKLLAGLRQIAKLLRLVAPPLGNGIPPAPWVVGNQIMSIVRRQ